MNAHTPRLSALAPVRPAPPPIGVAPTRYGNGRVELQIYPAAMPEDRIAAAALLLSGTGFHVAPQEKG